MTVGLIIVAAGSALRMGGTDKVWAPLGSKPVVQWSIDHLAPATDHIVVVVRAPDVASAAERLVLRASDRLVPGGAQRADSVRAGLAALPAVDVIAVHDAARPFAGTELLVQGIRLVDAADGAVPSIPVRDTVKHVGPQRKILRTIDRRGLLAAQTPQVFRASALRSAHASEAEATDDSALVEAAGGTVVCFEGQSSNFKITTPFDLAVARLLVDSNLLR